MPRIYGKSAPKLSEEESRLVRESIQKSGYNKDTVAERLGYVRDSFRKVLDGSRGFPIGKRMELYQLLGSDHPLRFLVDFSGVGTRNIKSVSRIDRAWEELLKTYWRELRDFYNRADVTEREEIVTNLESLLKKYKRNAHSR